MVPVRVGNKVDFPVGSAAAKPLFFLATQFSTAKNLNPPPGSGKKGAVGTSNCCCLDLQKSAMAIPSPLGSGGGGLQSDWLELGGQNPVTGGQHFEDQKSKI